MFWIAGSALQPGPAAESRLSRTCAASALMGRNTLLALEKRAKLVAVLLQRNVKSAVTIIGDPTNATGARGVRLVTNTR